MISNLSDLLKSHSIVTEVTLLTAFRSISWLLDASTQVFVATASYIIIIIGNYVSVQANHTRWLIWLIIVDIRRTSSMRVMNKAEIFQFGHASNFLF